MTRHPGDRLIAVLIDWLFMCVWIGLVAAVTVPLLLIGATASLAPVAENAVAALVTVVPITIALAVMESGPRQSTPGKRARRLWCGMPAPATRSPSVVRSSATP